MPAAKPPSAHDLLDWTAPKLPARLTALHRVPAVPLPRETLTRNGHTECTRNGYANGELEESPGREDSSSLKIVILGLSITSSSGNSHATTYREMVQALSGLGHGVLFLERHVPL
jgi:hypothetical protein